MPEANLEPLFERPPRSREVFCNRTLNLRAGDPILPERAGRADEIIPGSILKGGRKVLIPATSDLGFHHLADGLREGDVMSVHVCILCHIMHRGKGKALGPGAFRDERLLKP